MRISDWSSDVCSSDLATSLWLGGALESRYPHLPAAELPTADAIVVLGGNTANGRANWFLPYDKETAIVRVDTAVKLYRAHRAPRVVLSGGALEGDVSEARGMAFLMKQQRSEEHTSDSSHSCASRMPSSA